MKKEFVSAAARDKLANRQTYQNQKGRQTSESDEGWQDEKMLQSYQLRLQ